MKAIKKAVALSAVSSMLVLTLASCSGGGSGNTPTLSRLDKAKIAYNNALFAQTQAEQVLADARSTLNAHTSELVTLRSNQAERTAAITNAEQAKIDGEKEYQKKQQETLSAQNALEKVKKEQAEPRKYQNNSLGFFIWNAEDSGSNIQKIKDYCSGNILGSTEVIPSLNSGTDAMSLQNFKASIQWIDKCNEMRQRENKTDGTDLKPLLITDWLMFTSELHADYSKNICGHHGNTNTCFFYNGENLAWGNYPAPDGPFNAWYTVEKEQYKITPEWNNRTGHYLNIVNSNYYATGFAINNDSSATNFLRYGPTYAQNFSYGASEKAYTTDQYRARIAAYEKYLKSLDTVLNNAKQAVTTASSAENAAKDQLTILENNIQKAKKTDEDALKRIEALPDIIATDNAAIQAAKQNLEVQQKAVADALAELNAAQEEQNSAAQTALETYLMTA